MSVSQTVRFNGRDLNEIQGLLIVKTDPFRPSPRKLTNFDIANANKSATSSALYSNKKIHVGCVLTRNGKEGFELGLQELQALLQGKEKLLTFDSAGTEVEYTATMSNVTVDEQQGGYGKLDIEFLASNPYSFTTATTTVNSDSSHTTATKTITNTWGGNVEQLPIIQITITSVTLGGGSGTITINNPQTQIEINVESSFAASDVLIINCKTRTVTINGAEADFTGTFPNWTGSQTIYYQDDFSSRNISFSVTYQKRNL